MKSSAAIFGVALICLTSCSKRTPVVEVSIDQSGVAVVDHDQPELENQWPQWRGPDGSGVATDQPLPVEWSDTTNVKWRRDIPGRGHGSPTVVDGMIVLTTAIESSKQQVMFAFDQDSGEERWQTVLHEGGFPSGGEVHPKATNANGTVATDGSLLITAMFNDDRIFVTAIDLTGSQVWQKDIGAFVSRHGYAPSPVIYKSLVIVAVDTSGGGYLVGLDIATGEIAWRRARGAADSFSSPRVATLGGVDQLLITGTNRLASYDPATGEPRWETEGVAEFTCGTVVVAGDRIYASGGYPEAETVCMSATGEILWSDRTKLYEPSLITDGQFLFGVTDNGIAQCWSLDDGKQLWRQRLGGNFTSSPVICNGNIYVADLSGKGYVFKASGDDFESVAVNQLGTDCYASPAIANESLYFRVGTGQGANRTEQLVCISATP